MWIYSKQGLEMVRTPPADRESSLMVRHLGPGYGEFRAITNRSSRESRVRNHMVIPVAAHAPRSLTIGILAAPVMIPRRRHQPQP